jgi:antitoxin PrlF
MASSTITSKGQTTIPGAIRKHLKLKAGDRLDFIVERDGRVVLIPASVHVSELRGLLAPAPRRLTIEQMDEAVSKAAVARGRRGLK